MDLEDVIDISIVHPISYPNGWTFEKYDSVANNTNLDISFLRELYLHQDQNLQEKLRTDSWDKKTNNIVNNESSEIIRMLDGPLVN